MFRTLTLISLLFLSSCSSFYKKETQKPKIFTCNIVKKYNDEKSYDSSSLLHVSIDEYGYLHKVSVIKTVCGKLNESECVKFEDEILQTVFRITNIEDLYINKLEDWKELNLIFKPSLIKSELKKPTPRLW